MKTIHLDLKRIEDNSYDILIDINLLSKIPLDLKKNNIGNKYLIITDSNIEKLFGRDFLQSMRKNGLNAELISFKAGEKSKNLKVFEELIEKVHKLGLDRKSAIIALGGGVVGDMAGFVAACYMRGINYVQVPTSLLAMVDSSIGGKVAVDLSTGKNIVGNFYQPKRVYADVSLIQNLPQKEIINGLAEIIKHALIRDKDLFSFLDKNIEKIISKDKGTLIKIIKRNCEIKADIVVKDEKESGLRKLVNYGHTVGHALETLTNYGKYSHGEAIAIGMVVAGRIASKMGMLSNGELVRQNNLIKKAGLPIKVPQIDTNKIINELGKDKKVVGGKIEFVLLEEIGKAKYGISVPDRIIIRAIEESK